MPVPFLPGIAALAPRYDGFIVDLWGVVHDGIRPLPGALDCLQRLMGSGKRVVLLSNAPRRAEDVVRRIARIGVPADRYHHVMSSGEEAWQFVARREDPFYAALGTACLHIGSDRDMEMREGLEVDFVDDPARASFILNTGPAGWDDTIADYAPMLEQARARDLPMVCANPDLVVLHGGKRVLCGGALAQFYEAQGGRVRWHGKPHRSVYDTCFGLLGIADRRRILAIGDSLRTDIAGAEGAGIDSLLIASGIHAEEFGLGEAEAPDLDRIDRIIAASGFHPVGVARGLVW